MAVVLPGTGSGADFVTRAFREPLAQLGIYTVAVEPNPRRMIGSYLDALDEAARAHGPILVGGISIGAAVALRWATSKGAEATGVLAALPAWTGSPEGAPAAAGARYTANQLRAHGLDAVTATMIDSSPAWLGVELAKSWRAQWPDLPTALDEAARYHGPGEVDLAGLTVPVGIAAAVDDPVHPVQVAREWAAALPRAEVCTVTLDEIGFDPSILGRAGLAALERAGQPR